MYANVVELHIYMWKQRKKEGEELRPEISQILEGNFVYESGNIEFSCSRIEIELEDSSIYEGEFSIYSDVNRPFNGTVTTSDHRMICQTPVFEENEAVKSHLTFGAEYDSVLEWFIKTEIKTRAEIAEDSTEWGNHWNTENPPRKVVETGSREEWCANNIYDFAGNVDEWTQEQNNSSYRVIRGGNYSSDGNDFPVAYRNCSIPYSNYIYTGFRATLYIK